LFFTSKWDTLSVLTIDNEKHFVSENRGTAPLNLFSGTQAEKVGKQEPKKKYLKKTNTEP
jgi:hypothetical protein